jgi:hypothetical protein
MKRQKHQSVQRYVSALICSGLALMLLLLSACGSSTSTTPVNSGLIGAIATPAIDPVLTSQGTAQLQSFQQWIGLVKQYGGDTTTYQQQYNVDLQALQQAKTNADYRSTLNALNGQVNAIQIPAMKIEDQKLQRQLKQEVTAWGQQHKHYNAYDNTNYPLGYEYGDNGIGGWVLGDLTPAKTLADYQQAIENLNMYLSNFQALKGNSKDSTPYNKVHKTDLELMQHYGKTNQEVVVVSLEEQAMRVYDNGKLVNAFLVTTGRPDRPTPPGVWWVEGKQSPTVFKSGVPQSSPDWYPDTPINYAMQFHSEGYFLHDSWWRDDYGPGTNYPHVDSSGDSFSSQGSHGCVNLSKTDAGWLYGFVNLYTSVIIY